MHSNRANSLTVEHNAETLQGRERIEYKKYMNELNQILRSFITAGKLKRMELLSMNNRALFNHAKVKRSQWISRRHLSCHHSFLPDISSLRLDTQKSNQKHKKQSLQEIEQGCNSPYSRNKNCLLNRLIDEQMTKITKQKLYEKKYDRQKVITNACEQIQKILKGQVEKQQHKRSQQYVSPKQGIKNHRRSVTQKLYNSSIQSIKKKEEANRRERKSNRKVFVRKLRNIRIHSDY